jgi:hypothetical protein
VPLPVPDTEEDDAARWCVQTRWVQTRWVQIRWVQARDRQADLTSPAGHSGAGDGPGRVRSQVRVEIGRPGTGDSPGGLDRDRDHRGGRGGPLGYRSEIVTKGAVGGPQA